MSSEAPMSEELSLQAPGLALAARAWGRPEGRPLLAVHGWLDNANSFARLAPLLEGWRVVALDLPGHGRSDHRAPGVAYHFVDWVVDVVAAADALGWERFSLLGHSMGAAVACLVAGTVPERLERVVMIEGLGPMACPPEEAPVRLARSIAQRGQREAKRARTFADREAAAARLQEANAELGDDAARLLVERGTREVAGGVTWSSDPRLRGLSPMRMTEEHVRAFLARIACPALVLRALAGYPADPDLMAERFAVLRDGRLVELDGGHHVHLDRPEAVADAVALFLEGAAAAAPSDAGAAHPEASVRLVALDVDGVLTCGGLFVDGEGRETKRFDIKDGQGVKLLARGGIQVALISGRRSGAVEARARDLGIEHVFLGVRDKVAVLAGLLERLDLTPAEAAFMGDDLADLAVMRRVGFAAAPADASAEVRRVARLVTRAPGGRGAVRELAEFLLRAQGRWTAVLAHLAEPPTPSG